jgi:hypothetical protein
MTAATYDIRTAARAAFQAGIRVLPPREDGSKTPDVPRWKQCQTEPCTEADMRRWYGDHGRARQGLGALMGPISGGLELYEFDHRDAYLEFKALAAESGHAELVERVESGYHEDTPGGGVHWLLRCPGARESAKLACRHKRPEEFNDGDRKAIAAAAAKGRTHQPIKTLVETKDQGGYAVLAPSGGSVHPSGRPYRLLRGSFATIAHVTPEELATLWELGRALDEMPAPEQPGPKPSQANGHPGGNWPDTTTPWDDYNARTSWTDLLAGWTFVRRKGDTEFWRRPGKSEGISATLNRGGSDRLFAFSTSTEFEPNKPYSKFDTFALLEHRGDAKAAAKALYERGFGTFKAWVWQEETGTWALQVLPNPCPPGGKVRIAKPGEPPPPPFGSRAKANGDAAGESRSRDKRPHKDDAENQGPDFPSFSDDDLGILRLSAIQCRPLRWLWKYRLSRGGLSMMAGEGGMGKTLMLLWMATAVSKGAEWPDGGGKAPLGNVIIVSAEDRPDDTLKPRLRAMGADVDRIFIVKAKYIRRRPGKPPEVNFASFRDVEYWQEVFRRIPDVALFIVDPVPSYLGRTVNDSKNSEVRAVLEPFLDQVIAPRDVCMIGNTHLNKSVDARTPLHRISGSIAYGNLPRNVHFVVREPENHLRRFLKQAKCNNAPDDLPALAFQVESREITADDGAVIETAIPVFEPNPVTIDLGDIVTGNSRGNRRGPATDKARIVAELVFDLLADANGPMLWAALAEAVGAKGFLGERDPETGYWKSPTVLYRAKDLVPSLPPPRAGKRVESLKMRRDGRGKELTYWYLVDRDAEF